MALNPTAEQQLITEVPNILEMQLRSCTLGDHLRVSVAPLPKEIREKTASSLKPDQSTVSHLNAQLEKYFSTHPEDANRFTIKEENPLEQLLNIALRITQAGSGEHSDTITTNEGRVTLTTVFDIDKKPATKCNHFNDTFVIVFEELARKFNLTQILNQYKLLPIRAEHAHDVYRERNGQQKSLRHGYLMLISLSEEDSLNLTPIDPYHADSWISPGLDKTPSRQIDTILGFYRLFDLELDPKYGFQETNMYLVERVFDNLREDANFERVSLVPLYARLNRMLHYTKLKSFDGEYAKNSIDRLESFLEQTRIVFNMYVEIDPNDIPETLVNDLQAQKNNIAELSQKFKTEEEGITAYNAMIERYRTLTMLVIDQIMDSAITALENGEYPDTNSRSRDVLRFTDNVEDLADMGIELGESMWERMIEAIKLVSRDFQAEIETRPAEDGTRDYIRLMERSVGDYFSCAYEPDSSEYKHYVEFKAQTMFMLCNLQTDFFETWISSMQLDKNGNRSKIQNDVAQAVVELIEGI